jgi:hypothetical protein
MAGADAMLRIATSNPVNVGVFIDVSSSGMPP